MEKNKKANLKGFKIFIMIFLILSVFLLREENQNRLIRFLNSIGGKEKVLKLVDSFEGKDIEDISIYDNTIIKWSNNKASFIKFDGTIILEKEFNFQEPAVYYGDKYIYIMDKSTGDIYTFNNQGDTIDRMQLEKKIFNLKESHENLIYHIKDLDMESIRILNKDRILLGTYSYKDNNVLSYATNKEGKKSVISLLDLSKEALKTQIEVYGENKEKLNELDIKDEIVLYVDFTSKDEIVALSDSGLYFIRNGKIMWRKQFDLIKDIYLEDNKVNVLYSNSLETIDFDGRTENKISFSEDYEKILPFEGMLLIYGSTDMIILQEGKEVLRHEDSIVKVATDKGNIVLWNTDGVSIYKVSNK